MNRFYVIALFIIHTSAWAHSGGTDRNGGHHDRSDNSYHFHHGERAHQHENGKCVLNTGMAYQRSSATMEKQGYFPWWLAAMFFRIILLLIVAAILYKIFR